MARLFGLATAEVFALPDFDAVPASAGTSQPSTAVTMWSINALSFAGRFSHSGYDEEPIPYAQCRGPSGADAACAGSAG